MPIKKTEKKAQATTNLVQQLQTELTKFGVKDPISKAMMFIRQVEGIRISNSIKLEDHVKTVTALFKRADILVQAANFPANLESEYMRQYQLNEQDFGAAGLAGEARGGGIIRNPAGGGGRV